MKLPYQIAGHLPSIFLLGKPEEKAARQEKVTNPNYSWTHGPGFKFKRRTTVEVQVRAQIPRNDVEVESPNQQNMSSSPNTSLAQEISEEDQGNYGKTFKAAQALDEPAAIKDKNNVQEHDSVKPETGRSAAGRSTNVQAEYVTRSGRRYPSVNSLPESERTKFLQEHDPVRTLQLTDESKFYRVAARSAIINSTISGGAEEIKARISNHLALTDSPALKRIKALLSNPNLDQASRDILSNHSKKLSKVPLSMEAADLPDSGINVMHGPDAIGAAMDYMKADRILIEMNLGDFRRAGGGVVFRDIGSAGSYTDTVPLFISLPEGATIPVKLVEHAN